MKNIIRAIAVVLLSALLVSACVSCGGKLNAKDVVEMYANRAPTKIESRTVQTSGDITFTGKYTLTTGFVGGKAAALYEEDYQELRTVEEGGQTTTIYEYIKDVHNLFQYVEDKGTRQVHPDTHIAITDWKLDGKVFSIEEGSFALNLKNKLLDDESYDKDTRTFSATVPEKHTQSVFGESIAADVKIAIVNDGAQIISVHVEYDLPADGNVQATHIVIDVEYTYDNERISID